MVRRPVLITQRVVIDPTHGERRDALDQRWADFLGAGGLFPVAVPNDIPAAKSLFDAFPTTPLLLTGGNDLAVLGGDAPERDAVERMLLDQAALQHRAVLGVCRGMQMLLFWTGRKPILLTGHVGCRHEITLDLRVITVNSFHNFGFTDAGTDYIACGRATDGTVEAIRHCRLPFTGIMWHPEREDPKRAIEIDFVRESLFPTDTEGR
jgi:N5-(cytidine 5'-diphosphoramidyl)-L-glutamine hydrolase